MSLLVVGANGLVGSSLVATGLDRGHDVVGTYHTDRPAFDIRLTQLDIRDWPPAFDVGQFDAVVNCAAMTDVDGCERDPELARTVNAVAPKRIAETCARTDTRFVHLSTDYVFDGTADAPYDESAAPNPIQVYGESKHRGEQQVLAANDETLLLRLAFVYGVHGATDQLTGFPAWVAGKLRDREPVPLFTDQHVTPSRAGQVASAILDLLEASVSGTYHVASQSCVTPFEFGKYIAEHLDADETLLEAGTMADVDRPAQRPSATCLSTDRLAETLGRPQPTLREDIAAIGATFE